MEEDADGNVVAYRDITNVAYDDDADADAAEEEAGELKKKKKKKKKRGLFGFGRGGGDDDDDVEKDDPFVRNRLMSVLDKDRGGWRAPVVRMEFNSACVYEGEMVGGKQEGEGKQVYPGGDWYEGRWRDGVPDGRGRLRYANGGMFEGMWRDGVPCGPGVLDLTEQGGVRVDGRWSNGKLEDEWGKV